MKETKLPASLLRPGPGLRPDAKMPYATLNCGGRNWATPMNHPEAQNTDRVLILQFPPRYFWPASIAMLSLFWSRLFLTHPLPLSGGILM